MTENILSLLGYEKWGRRKPSSRAVARLLIVEGQLLEKSILDQIITIWRGRRWGDGHCLISSNGSCNPGSKPFPTVHNYAITWSYRYLTKSRYRIYSRRVLYIICLKTYIYELKLSSLFSSPDESIHVTNKWNICESE